MTAYSQNQWSANDRSVIASYSLPGGKVALRAGDVSVVLLWCANQWHQTVEPLVWPGIWGYAERTVRGSSTTLSNHASGTAIDLNAPQHPLAVPAAKTFTAAQIAQVRRIVDACEGTVRWGGDYDQPHRGGRAGSRPDAMHLEINAGAAAVRRVADQIRSRNQPPPAPPVKPVRPVEDDVIYLKCESVKGGPIWTGLLSGGVLIGPLTTGEMASATANLGRGAWEQWIERATWDRLKMRSTPV